MYKVFFLIMLRKAAVGFFFFLMLLFHHISCTAGTTEEITSLLLFVEESKCTFIRNGNHYDALTARKHIEKKYINYKEKINTAEDFIQYSATKSSITDKPYMVICNGVKTFTSDWLNAKLAELRIK